MNEDAMKVTSHCRDGLPTQLVIEGAMTIYEADALKHELLTALNAGPALAIDLSGVDELDSAGLQLLVLLQREAARDAKPLHVSARSAAVDEVFDRYGLHEAFDAPDVVARDITALAAAIASQRNSHEP